MLLEPRHGNHYLPHQRLIHTLARLRNHTGHLITYCAGQRDTNLCVPEYPQS